MFNPNDCEAEFIDGNYSDCGCPVCGDATAHEIESQFEAGLITHEEALEAHDENDQSHMSWDD
ncbi:hypothetical protein [Nocardiopsis sp. FIRDI 009]|uniref:hypothetical protein n=1 Tax=Nocardiopsis sp. FIRDI 009 TaxID=714197 RepID=UPI000E267170|nr:hypothetical protein [Nocardiopsis sp. FIRDI 009]